MCWISKKSIQPIIATEDISVIKVLSKHIRLYKEVLISPYYGMEYKLDELYETDIKVEHGDCITSISEGFHSYSLKCPLKKTSNALIVWTKDCTNVITGYIDNVTPDTVYLAVIPKGATYYENDNGEIVSNQIKLLKKYG